MKNINKILILSIAVTSLNACNFKKSTRDAHEDARATNLTIENTDDNNKKTLNTLETKQDLATISKGISSAQTADQLVAQLTQLEARAINAEEMMDVKDNKSNEVRTALTYYNYAIIRLGEVAPNSKELQTYMDKYEHMALTGCDADLKGCLNYSFLKTDPRSAKVLQLIVSQLDKKMDSECKTDCNASLKRYYNLLALAFDLGNMTRNTDTEFLYVKRAQEYGALYQKENGTNSAFFKKHGTIFDNIVSQYPADANNKKFAEFVKAFKPWNYSRLNPNPFPFGVQKMFSFAALNYLYTADKKELNQDVKAVIEASQKEIDKAGPSFKMIVDELKSDSRSAGIFKSLNLDVSIIEKADFYNEYFFMVDRLYRGHIGIEEAASFWEGSKQDSKALLSAVDFYTKIELLKRIVETNKYMGNIFIQKDVPSDTLFKQVIQRSEPLTKEWNMMFSRMENISIFVSQQLRNTKTSANDFKDVQLMIDTVKRNATFLSVYPNMLIMSYFMIDANASIKFNTWWGAELSIDPATIMGLLLDGGFPKPWFVFGGGTTSLDKTEMIYAFHYALNTGSFETFEKIQKGSTAIDRISFFKKALKKTVQEDVDKLKDAMQKLADDTASDAAYSAFMNACANESAGNKDYEIAMKLVDLQYYTVFGNAKRGLLAASDALYSSASPMAISNEVRRSLESRLVQLKAMMDVLQYNLKNLSMSAADFEQTKKELQLEIDNIENAKKTYLKKMIAQHNLLSKCTNKLTILERERQSALFTAEIQHLERVYAELVTLKSLSGDAKKAQATVAATKLGLSEDENISQDSYVYSRYSLLTRMANASKDMKPTVVFEKPDKYGIDGLSTSIEKVNFLNPVTKQVVTKDEFVAAGMTILNPQGSTALLWLQESASIDGWQNKIASMVSLYKMGFDSEMQNDAKSSIKASDIINEVIEMTQFVNITPAEKVWLKKMNRRERIPRERLKGFLFENSESDFKGIMDDYYGNATDVKFLLDQATDFYISSKNIGKFLFPVPTAVQDSITGRYKQIVKRSENIIKDFDAAIKLAESTFDSQKFAITYRSDEVNDYVYRTSLIDGGNSVLLDKRRLNDTQSMLNEFHVRKTGSFYKTKEENK